MRTQVASPLRPFRLVDDKRGVSDVVGSVLLVGITVTMMAGLAMVVLSVPAPEGQVHLKLDIRLHPGPDGEWGTGDEELRIKHMGGHAVSSSRVIIHILVDEERTTLEGEDVDFEDGRLKIGDTWTYTMTLSPGDPVAVDVIHRGDPQQLIASASMNIPEVDS